MRFNGLTFIPCHSAQGSCGSQTTSGLLPSGVQIRLHFLQAAGVEDLLRREPGLAGDPRAGEEGAILARRVGVGVDAEADAAIESTADDPPVDVEAIRIAVDLDHHTALAGALEDALVVERVSLPGAQAPAGHAAQAPTAGGA